MWSDKTKPTPANIRKRLDAALEALEAAADLAARHPSMGKKLQVPIKHARAWAADARGKTCGRQP